MSRRLAATFMGVAVLVMAMAGCGDSGDDALTKSEFIKQGDAICKKTTPEISAGYQAFAKEKGLKVGTSPTQEQGYEIAEDIYLPAYQRQVESLRELSPPEGEVEKVDAILSEVEDNITGAQKNLETLFRSQGKSPLAPGQEMLRSYGFEVCGSV